jgi:acyl carrier protein
LTAERFTPDPYSAEPGGRLYRTGDLARYTEDGKLDFLGRVDGQLKIRGYRIELGEIEVVLGQHPGVKEVLVVAQGADANKQLVAYVVGRDGNLPSIAELRNWVKERLPDYMAPAHFVGLERMPLTPNGKVDRKALPRPREATHASPQSLQANKTEENLIEIWKELLGISAVGLDDNFFDLGGHSLLITRMSKMIEERLHTPIRIIHLFRYPTIRSLAGYLSESQEPEETTETGGFKARKNHREQFINKMRAMKKAAGG